MHEGCLRCEKNNCRTESLALEVEEVGGYLCKQRALGDLGKMILDAAVESFHLLFDDIQCVLHIRFIVVIIVN